jgi:hypothetical protein
MKIFAQVDSRRQGRDRSFVRAVEESFRVLPGAPRSRLLGEGRWLKI